MMNFGIKNLLFLIVFVILLLIVIVQVVDFDDLILLGMVVVIVVGVEIMIVMVFGSVIVIILDQLEQVGVIDLIDVLCSVFGVLVVGGVDVENIYICGFLVEYLLIFVDGKCQDMWELCINGLGGVDQYYIFLVLVIEWIEVVCGLMLLFYGFEVMGGVINIIMKFVFLIWIGLVMIEGIVFEYDEDSVE